MSRKNQYVSRGSIFVLVVLMILIAGRYSVDATIMTGQQFYYYDLSSYSVDNDNNYVWFRWPESGTDITCLAPRDAPEPYNMAIFDMNYEIRVASTGNWQWVGDYDFDPLWLPYYPYTWTHIDGGVQQPIGFIIPLDFSLDSLGFDHQLLLNFSNLGTWQLDLPQIALGSYSGIIATPFVSGSEVPEPTTMLLLGTGLVGLAGFGRKRFFKK